MTLEDINYIAQTAGGVAILGTFVAVLIQMRQNDWTNGRPIAKCPHRVEAK